MTHPLGKPLVSTGAIIALGGLLLVASPTFAGPVAQTTTGLVEGRVTGTVHQFLGVPYAAAPLGPLRWRAPEPAQPWTDVRKATVPGAACPQQPSIYSKTPTSEDCLYVNVHVPVSAPAPRPVMVWLHSGGIAMGSGSDYDGAVLAEQTGAVVVTVNNRLGILGLMSSTETQQESASANYAIQDQQQALRWVRDNIAAFGGQPGQVTLFGNSAGAMGACIHLVSPGSAGLFHRAILQSGPCFLAGTQTPEQARQHADAMAARVGCPTGPGQLACLRSVPAQALVAAAPDALDLIRTPNPWQPVIDGTVLPARTTERVREGRFHKVPVMIGTTRNEGRFFVAYSYHQKLGRAMTEEDYRHSSDLLAGSALTGMVARLLYPSSMWGSPGLAMSAFMTDAGTACPALADASRFSRHVPVYAYEFTDPSPPSAADPYFAWGAYHTAELQYLFGQPVFVTDVIQGLSGSQAQLADRMRRYWGAFARTGNPNTSGLPTWPRFNAWSTPFLNLAPGNTLAVTDWGGYQKAHQCTTWNLLLGLSGQN